MKRLLVLSLVSITLSMPQVYSISVAEYIQQNGMPEVVNGDLNLANKNLTDLTGLQDIPNKDRVIFLVLTENQLQTLPINIFNGFTNLRNLYLNLNQIQALPNGIFNGLNNLTLLNLSSNQLKTLPIGIFNGLNNLEALFLSYNQIQTLPANIFNGLPRLELLALFGNPFSVDFLPALPSIIKGIPRLRSLDYMSVDRALKSYRIYQPKSLLETSARAVIKNSTPAQRMNAYRDRLHLLSSDILELLPLTPGQRAGIAARQR